jgi:calcium-dependent protein kinase
MKNYDSKCDVWSCGVIMYILLSGKPPFNSDNSLEIMRLIKEGKILMTGSVWQYISSNAKDLILKMLTYRPEKRYSANQALDH